MFTQGQYNFNACLLPMKGRRHPNSYVERCGKEGCLGRSITSNIKIFLTTNLGTFEADTVKERPSWSGNDASRPAIQARMKRSITTNTS